MKSTSRGHLSQTRCSLLCRRRNQRILEEHPVRDKPSVSLVSNR